MARRGIKTRLAGWETHQRSGEPSDQTRVTPMKTQTPTETIERIASDYAGGSLSVAARWLAFLGGPLGAAVAMWYHPHAGDDAYASLAPVIDEFLLAHGLLFASLALVAAGVYFLSAGSRSLAAQIARVGAGAFAFFYLGYVAIVGIAKGLVIRYGQSLSSEQQAGVAAAVQQLHTDQLLFAAGVIGAVAYLIAVLALVVDLYRRDAPRVPLVLLVGSIAAIGAHQGLLAVAGMTSFAIAAAWLEIRWRAVDPSTAA